MEKRQHCKSHISKLKTNDNMEINDPKTILEQGKMFFKNLDTVVHCNNLNYKLFFENSNIAKLEATQQEELERPLLNKECFLRLKQCSKNKTPGTDGLSVEFYLRFWSLLGEEMVQSLNYAYEHGQLNITQKRGIIKVIPKKRKDKSFPEN